MLLVDKDIEKLVTPDNDIEDLTKLVPPYIAYGDKNCVTNIGYDLNAGRFFKNGKDLPECVLAPGESVFVSSKEVIGLDGQTVGKVTLKNSRIRMGLTMDAPVYQPGHVTNIYFRLTNISDSKISLTVGESYAMIMFEQLIEAPVHQYNGTFQKEFNFKGLAGYDSQYMDQIQSIGDQVRDIKSLEKTVYGNVITILTIFVAVFTILNVNIELTKQAVSGLQFLAYNIVTLGSMSFLSALISEILHKGEGKKARFLWAVPIICFLVAIILFFIDPNMLHN